MSTPRSAPNRDPVRESRGLTPPARLLRFHMLLWLLRGAYATLLIGMALYAFNLFFDVENPAKGILVPLGILGVGGLVLFTDVKERQKQITTISAIYFGL